MKKLKWKGKVKKWKWRRNNASEKGRWNKIVKLKGCYSKVSVEVKPGKPHGSLAFCRSRLSKLVQGCLTDWTSLTRFCQHLYCNIIYPPVSWHIVPCRSVLGSLWVKACNKQQFTTSRGRCSIKSIDKFIFASNSGLNAYIPTSSCNQINW